MAKRIRFRAGSQERRVKNLTRNPGLVSRTELEAIVPTLFNLKQHENAHIMARLLAKARREKRSLIRMSELGTLEKTILDAVRQTAYRVP